LASMREFCPIPLPNLGQKRISEMAISERHVGIVIAVITLVDAIGGAAISNLDKISESFTKTFLEPSSGTFQDFEMGNGTAVNGDIDTYCRDMSHAACNFEGKIVNSGRSIRVDVEKHSDPGDVGGVVRIFPSSNNPIDLSAAKSISLWVYDTQGNNTVELRLCNGDLCPKNQNQCPDGCWSDRKSTKGKWVKLSWPIQIFSNINISSISGIELHEWNDGVYYFDDINWQ
jgi:hypothetical protein